MEYTTANLEYAVSVFYNCEASERAQAHQWLTTAQRCPEAWSFVWELLQSHKGTEVQFFAATTLHTKLLRCWNEVPPENHEELKNKILEAIHAFSNGPKIVLNRLCISLAAYIMQQGASDLVSTLRPLSAPENLSVLLEILTVIPEEFNSMTMGAALRSKTKVALKQAAPAVLDDMLRHLQTAYDESPLTEARIQTWSKASSCVASWLVLGGDSNMSLDVNTECPYLADCLPLCQALLKVVHRIITIERVLSDGSMEACEAALGAVRAAATAPPAVALQVARMLVDLTSPLLSITNSTEVQDEDLLAALFTCAVAIGECHTRAIARVIDKEAETRDSSARDLVELFLTCQSSPGYYPIHETRSALTFGFWYMLQDEVVYLNVTSLNNIFTRLLNVLIEKSKSPDESSLPSDDAELLRRYRQDIADTVMCCWGVLGVSCWSTVVTAWNSADSDAAREAVLHIMLSLSDAASTKDPPPEIATMLRHATHQANSTSHIRLLETSLECLGTYASWLGSLSGEEGQLVRDALQAAGASLPKAPARAALALRKLSAECRQYVSPLADQIVDAALAGYGQHTSWVVRQLLGAAGAALCAAPAHQAFSLLCKLSEPIHNHLLQEGEEISRLGAKSCPRGAVQSATALLTALSEQHQLAASLLARLLPTLPPLTTHLLQVPLVFQFLKQAVQIVMDDCLPIMDDLSALVLQALQTSPCSSGTDLIRLIVLMFGAEWSGSGALLRACVEVCLRACVSSDLASVSDVAEGLFVALTSLAKKKPQYLDYLGELLPQTVELGCACVPLWEAGAARGACCWLSALAGVRPADLRAHAPHLAAIAVRCIGGATPRNQVEPLADLLLALNRATWSETGEADGDLGTWLKHALEPSGYPSPHASDKHKHNFIMAVVKNKRNRRRVLESVQEFSLVCRGLIDTEYARQTLASRQLVA